MKKYFLLFSFFIIALSACNKNQETEQPIIDDIKIQAYIKANNVTGLTKDPSGIYYKVLIPGTGPYPVASFTATSSTAANTGSTVKFSYTGIYLNGQNLQSATGTQVTLNTGNLINGFLYGIPHINAGGRILLIIPSGLAYGKAGSDAIPANSILIFTVDLTSFY